MALGAYPTRYHDANANANADAKRALHKISLIVSLIVMPREICTSGQPMHWHHTMHILRCISPNTS